MFGVFLNKSKPTVPSQSGDDNGNTGEKRAPTWKLRKWTKGQGYKTVKMEDAEERGEGMEDVKNSDNGQTHLVTNEAGPSVPNQLQVSKRTLVAYLLEGK